MSSRLMDELCGRVEQHEIGEHEAAIECLRAGDYEAATAFAILGTGQAVRFHLSRIEVELRDALETTGPNGEKVGLADAIASRP